MTREKLALIIAAGLGMSVIPAAQAQGMKPLNKAIKEQGFQPLVPIVQNFAPSLVFVEGKDDAGNVVQSVICESLYETRNPAPNSAILAGLQLNNTSDTKASLKLLPGVFKDLSAEAKYAAAGITKGALSFETPMVGDRPPALSATTGVRKISKACAEVLAPYFNADGKANSAVFIVARTLSVGGIAYDMQVKREKSGGLLAALTNIFGLNFDFKKTSDTTATIKFASTGASDRMVVGYNKLRIPRLSVLSTVASLTNANVEFAATELVTDSPVKLNIQRPR